MSEIINKVNELCSAWEEFKRTNESRISAIEKRGYADFSFEEKLEKINNSINNCTKKINLMKSSSVKTSSIRSDNSMFRDFLKKSASQYDVTVDVDIMRAEVHENITSSMAENSVMRKMCTPIRTSAAVYYYPVYTDPVHCSWGDIIVNTDGSMRVIEIKACSVWAQMILSHATIEDSETDLQKWVEEELSSAFAADENRVFVSGLTTSSEPEGLLNSQIQKSSAQNLSADSLIELVYKVGNQYYEKGKMYFMMNQDTEMQIRKLKYASGEYIWSPGVNGEAHTLLGYPISLNTHMPIIPVSGGSSINIIFGNFNKGYKIMDRTDFEMKTDPYTYKTRYILYASKRVGGGLVDVGALHALIVIAQAQ